MNRSRNIVSLLAAGLAVLAVSAFAQSSPSGSSGQSDRTRPSGSATGTMTAPTTGSTAGSIYGSDRPQSGQQGNTLHGSGGVSGASSQSANVHGFTSIDRDRDGRISLSEFTASSQSGAAAGSGTAGMTGRSAGTVGTGTTGTTGAARTTGTTGTAGRDPRGTSSTGLGGTSAQMEQEFRRLDTDRDGYLSEAELSIWQGENTQSGQGGSSSGASASGQVTPGTADKSKERDRNH